MKAKNCLIFGGSGQIGRHLIRKLTKNNYKVTVVTRNLHQKGYAIKTQANAGYIDIVEANIFDEKKIRKLFSQADICINLIGILYEVSKGNTFKNIHSIFPSILAKLCKEYKVQQFIHLSALGINNAIDSRYAKSKLDGELSIQKKLSFSNNIKAFCGLFS
ncbi:NAD-dependent epimerase/dehydratase family protein [Candidatus Pelagibacter sp.]|nr:NAD-dependent epimerase/dehydratase family protein [Candidatus Pelagibacter sp.]